VASSASTARDMSVKCYGRRAGPPRGGCEGWASVRSFREPTAGNLEQILSGFLAAMGFHESVTVVADKQ
jgi:hypothetical protein